MTFLTPSEDEDLLVTPPLPIITIHYLHFSVILSANCHNSPSYVCHCWFRSARIEPIEWAPADTPNTPLTRNTSVSSLLRQLLTRITLIHPLEFRSASDEILFPTLIAAPLPRPGWRRDDGWGGGKIASWGHYRRRRRNGTGLIYCTCAGDVTGEDGLADCITVATHRRSIWLKCYQTTREQFTVANICVSYIILTLFIFGELSTPTKIPHTFTLYVRLSFP